MAGETEGRVLRIRKWDERFLTAKTRGRKGPLRSVLVPVKLGDLEWRAIAKLPNGAAVLGVWLALVEVAASREERDGRLAHGGERFGIGLNGSELAELTDLAVADIEAGIAVLVEKRWLIPDEIPNGSEPFRTIPQRDPISEAKGRERGGPKASPPLSSPAPAPPGRPQGAGGAPARPCGHAGPTYWRLDSVLTECSRHGKATKIREAEACNQSLDGRLLCARPTGEWRQRELDCPGCNPPASEDPDDG